MKKEKDYTEFEVVKGNQLSESELKELREAVNRVNETQMQIGGLEAHKANLLAEILVFTKEVESTQKILAAKYGDVSIDLNTGQFTENASNKKD
tara:strand:+ start:1203 stop:1484 length:282 start_codon:yes stop_codon:yes gene_type:complete